MTDAPAPAEDRAWVKIETPLSSAELREFCRDIERLYRINPRLEFRAWRASGPGRFHAEWRNLSNDREESHDLEVVRESDWAFRVDYAGGIKALTRFAVEQNAAGARLTITDDYSRLPEAERAQRLDEVDRSLVPWGQGLHRYLRRQRRWGWFPPWRWYMRRLWLPMRPMARRIVWWLWVITLVEIALFLFVMLVYIIERNA
ncbi:MAG TPA: hypothetical protein VGA00_05370 [Acidiferrobacterales bacterium]